MNLNFSHKIRYGSPSRLKPYFSLHPTFLKVTLALALVVFCGVPVIFGISKTVQRMMLFMSFVKSPKNSELANPQSVGLYGTRNFYLHVEDAEGNYENGIRIGVWHVLPRSLMYHFRIELQVPLEEFNSDLESDLQIMVSGASAKDMLAEISVDDEAAFYEMALRVPGIIILYLHGNTASRGSSIRIELYKLLSKLGYHVVSIDYRGFGDSDFVVPTEEGVVLDALTAYQYIVSRTQNPVILWGHSLGTAVSTHLCAQISRLEDIQQPHGVVLESAFTNMSDELREHPFSKIFKILPWFDFTIVQPVYKNSLRFESDVHIGNFPQPVMILHAEDDNVVPFQLGDQLYRIAQETRDNSCGPVEFHRFAAHCAYGHKLLCRAPNLPKIVKNFVEKYRQRTYPHDSPMD